MTDHLINLLAGWAGELKALYACCVVMDGGDAKLLFTLLLN